MLTSGSRLGAFEIGPLIGAGGMGEVYRGRDSRLQRDVAIKVLPAALALDQERRSRFEREARLLATLNHPNIAAIYGVEEQSGIWALVLELVDGATLEDLRGSGTMPLPDVLRFANQLVDALDTAHERGIVHRDLKPANIKITPTGTLKVLDFGLAKAVQGSGPVEAGPTMTGGDTRDGLVMGTPAYMSPEQARGRAIDRRADIWAFGCVLFDLLAGERAFQGPSTSDVIVAVLDRQPPWSALPEKTPPALQRLLRRCLQKDPGARLRDIADARQDLADAALELEGKAVAGTVRPAAARWPLASGAAAAGIAATLLGVWLFLRSAAPPPVFSRVSRIVATSAHEFGPAISPDGKWIAYLSDARGPTDVWVKFIAGGEPANLTANLPVAVQTNDAIGPVQISPDGNWITFSAGTSGATARRFSSWVIPAPLGGTARRILTEGSQGLTWSPDGTRLAYIHAGGSGGDSIWVSDSDGQHAQQILPAAGGEHAHWLRWSHDGRFVYFNHGWQSFNTNNTEIFRVPAGGGAAEPAVRSSRRAVSPFPDATGRGIFYAANPDTVDLTLWWRDLVDASDYRLLTGVGEYGAPSVSADGRRLVATVTVPRQQIARLTADGTGPVSLAPLTDALSGDLDPERSPDGTHVAFSTTRGGNRNLWVALADLTGATPLTFGNDIDERPAYAPDGREIAFVSDRDRRRGVWLVDTEGGSPRLLAVTNVIGSVSWSRDGQRLVCAVPTGNSTGLVVIGRADGTITPLAVPGEAVTSPVWSPTEDVIAYIETTAIRASIGTFVRFVDSTGKRIARPLSDHPTPANNGFLSWAPDGRRLAVASVPGATPGSVWIVDPFDAVAARKLLDLPITTQLRGLSWTRDGRALLAGVDTRTSDIVLAERDVGK